MFFLTSGLTFSSHLNASPIVEKPRSALNIRAIEATNSDGTATTYLSVNVLSCQKVMVGGSNSELLSRVPSGDRRVISKAPFSPPIAMPKVSPVTGSVVGWAE